MAQKLIDFAHSALAALPLSVVARCRHRIRVCRRTLGTLLGSQRRICSSRRRGVPARRPRLDSRLPSSPRPCTSAASSPRRRSRPLCAHALPQFGGIPVPASQEGDPGRHARREPYLLPDVLVLSALHIFVCSGMWIRGDASRGHRCARTCYRHRILPCRSRRESCREGHVSTVLGLSI